MNFYDDFNVFYQLRYSNFIITNEEHAFLLLSYPYFYRLWSIDLTTGNIILFNDKFELPDFDFTNHLFNFMSHNKADDTTMFSSWQLNFIFKYNSEDNVFYYIDRKKRHDTWLHVSGVSVYDKNIWYTGYYSDHHHDPKHFDIGLHEYNINEYVERDPHSVRLHFIDVEYLNTLTLPQSALYAPPYIWLLIERESRVLMLKLLPYDANYEDGEDE